MENNDNMVRITPDEYLRALPIASAKRDNIIQHEGDANGERRKFGYFLQLVFEAVEAERFKKEVNRYV